MGQTQGLEAQQKNSSRSKDIIEMSKIRISSQEIFLPSPLYRASEFIMDTRSSPRFKLSFKLLCQDSYFSWISRPAE